MIVGVVELARLAGQRVHGGDEPSLPDQAVLGDPDRAARSDPDPTVPSDSDRTVRSDPDRAERSHPERDALRDAVVAAGSGLLPILEASLAGAGLLVLFGVLTPGEARDAVDLDRRECGLG